LRRRGQIGRGLERAVVCGVAATLLLDTHDARAQAVIGPAHASPVVMTVP